jgi:predicted N-acyltransferase
MALEPTLGPLAAQLTRWAPRLMNPVILAMGSPQADECPLGVDPAAAPNDRRAILAALLEGLAIHARTLGCSVTALKDLRDTDTLWAHNILKQAGFARAACLPLAVLELPYRDETEYLATLSPRLRSELRRKMRQASSVMTERRDSIDDIHDEIVSLFQETRSNRRADYGSFDDVGPGFFLEVMHSLKGRARVMLCRHGGELVSFNMFLVEANRVLAKFIGMRYPQARDLNLYYFNWLLMVRYCIEQGIPLLQTGQTTYEINWVSPSLT